MSLGRFIGLHQHRVLLLTTSQMQFCIPTWCCRVRKSIPGYAAAQEAPGLLLCRCTVLKGFNEGPRLQ